MRKSNDTYAGEHVRHVLRAPAARALDLNLVTKADLIRLKVIARVHARGLPSDVSWTDLLQEAFTRVLDGSRRSPEGVHIVAFLAGVMRSLKSEHWRKRKLQTNGVPVGRSSGETPSETLSDSSRDPERVVLALEALAALEQLFADDMQARQVISGLFEGLSPEEICAQSKMNRTDYESTRKRIRRVLVREGLRSAQP